MQLKPGDKLGPYEILSLLGKGGMGEVWRARDPRLNRDVAIKASRADFSGRFKTEAQAVAALNHPNNCTLHDVGPDYLVMELVEGPTLADRIRQGAIPLNEALGIAKQIADALEAAHEKGIVHRDLKPANIKIRPDGSIKVLDFGLATAAGEEKEFGPDSPTMLTAGGMILGTAGYMSPEQARGKKADNRADIWAFGVVLYEMVTGKRLFAGETVSDSLAATLVKEPDLTLLPGKIKPLLRACLQKDPKQRLQAIGDWKLLLADDAPAASAPLQSWLGKTGWIAAGALAIVAAVGLAGWYRAARPATLKPLVRLDVDLGAGVSLGSTNGTDTIISPDGTRLVYGSQGKLFTRKMDQPRAVELAGTDGAYAPFFSPDGQWVAFFASGKLKKISVEGGGAVALGDNGGTPRGGSWGEDGNIIAALSLTGVLSRIPSAGGILMPATELAQGEYTQRWPQLLPGGKAVLFTSNTSASGFDGANIEVMSLADHRRKTLQRGGTFGRYLPASNGTGHLVYINKGTLFAVPFDPDMLEVHGTPSPVLEEVAYNAAAGYAQFDFSRNGTLVYRTGVAEGGNLVTVQWLDAAGKTQPLLAKPGLYYRPRLSPDGQRLALDDGADIWVYEARRDTMTRLTFGGGADIFPVWSPGGRYIVFDGPGAIWWVRSDGAGKPQPLIQGRNQQIPYSFTPDGKRLAYFENNPGTSYDLWTATIESNAAGLRAGKPEIFLQTSADERHPAFSPDGRWLAYTSNESGKYEVYVRAFPDKGGKWQISNAGGTYPFWSGNGNELFFRTEDNRMIMVATYTAKADSFVPDKPRVWSDKRLANLGNALIANYDLAPDGKRIAGVMPVETPEAQMQSHVIFLENFADELQRKVPVGK